MQLKILFILLLVIFVSIAPSEWLSNITSAIGAVRDYTVAGSEVAKVTVKTYNAMKDNGEVSFSEAYGYQSKIDGVQKESRDEGINFLEDSKEYNRLLESNNIIDGELNTKYYIDGSYDEEGKHIAGASNIDKKEIYIDLLDGNKQVSAGNLENSYWHEVTHQNDKTNTTTRDREAYATNMGNSAEVLGSINNWLYGDGGLNNTTISNYYNKNQTTLQLNNEYVSNLNPFDLEYAEVHSRSLKGQPWGLFYNYIPIISEQHVYLKLDILKDDFYNLRKAYNREDITPIAENNGKVTIIVSGFPSGDSMLDNLLGKNTLMIQFNSKEDRAYYNDPSKHYIVGKNDNPIADYRAFEMALIFAKDNRVGYALIPSLFNNIFNVKKYNSNSIGISIAKISTIDLGGIDLNFKGFNPGKNEKIPEINFFP